MFGLFKRTKVEDWEIQLLRKVIMKLPEDYSDLLNQLSDGLFRGVLLGMSDIPGYVAFSFHSDVLKKYDRENERDYKLSNIKVYDRTTSNYLNFVVYISTGTISGYSLEGSKKHDIDTNKLEVSGFKKEYIGNSDYNRILGILDEQEKKLLTPSEVYSVYVNDKEYFHIKDLEDGDFIGVDERKVIYKITHDPMEVTVLDKKIEDILNI